MKMETIKIKDFVSGNYKRDFNGADFWEAALWSVSTVSKFILYYSLTILAIKTGVYMYYAIAASL